MRDNIRENSQELQHFPIDQISQVMRRGRRNDAKYHQWHSHTTYRDVAVSSCRFLAFVCDKRDDIHVWGRSFEHSTKYCNDLDNRWLFSVKKMRKNSCVRWKLSFRDVLEVRRDF